MWSLDLCDGQGRRRAFLTDHDGFRLTARLNDYAEFATAVDMLGTSAPELAVAERAIKVWQSGVLRFHGQVWEPLNYTPSAVSVVARDPLAAFKPRRVRSATGAAVVYTAVDAGAIASARLTAQNAYGATGLVAGTITTSVNRTRSYLPGQLEGDILEELSNAEDGFYYKCTPLDATPGVRGQLDIMYPDAGATRESVRLEYGLGTADNLTEFTMIRFLPLNRVVASSSASGGGRIEQAAENAASIAQYGLFENEETYTDVTDTTLLGQQARAGVRVSPQRTLELTCGPEAPLLFTEFNVGDFIRVRIKHGPLDLFVWVRVTAATLVVDKDGTQRMESITVETLTGQRLSSSVDPARRFRRQLDGQRRRMDALERRVGSITQTPTAGAGTDSPDTSVDDTPPAEPPTPPPPPPPTPPAAPSISGLTAVAGPDGTVTVQVDVNGNGVAATVAFALDGGYGTFGTQATGTGFAHAVATASGVPAGTYNVVASVNSAGGLRSIGPVVVIVPVAHGGV